MIIYLRTMVSADFIPYYKLMEFVWCTTIGPLTLGLDIIKPKTKVRIGPLLISSVYKRTSHKRCLGSILTLFGNTLISRECPREPHCQTVCRG